MTLQNCFLNDGASEQGKFKQGKPYNGTRNVSVTVRDGENL